MFTYTCVKSGELSEPPISSHLAVRGWEYGILYENMGNGFTSGRSSVPAHNYQSALRHKHANDRVPFPALALRVRPLNPKMPSIANSHQ